LEEIALFIWEAGAKKYSLDIKKPKMIDWVH
jgi:hypothetical protein